MSVINLTSQNFEEEVIKSSKTVIVDFYATWCSPCKVMSPIIDKIAEELGEKVKVGKMDIEENIDIAEKYEIMSIPTIIIFKNGEVINKFIGLTDKNEIMDAIS